MKFGDYIKQKRKDQDITAQELANVGNIDKTYVSKIENNKMLPPSEEVLLKWAELLNIEPIEILIKANKKVSKSYILIIEDILDRISDLIYDAELTNDEIVDKIDEILTNELMR